MLGIWNVNFVGLLANCKYLNMDETIGSAMLVFQKGFTVAKPRRRMKSSAWCQRLKRGQCNSLWLSTYWLSRAEVMEWMGKLGYCHACVLVSQRRARSAHEELACEAVQSEDPWSHSGAKSLESGGPVSSIYDDDLVELILFAHNHGLKSWHTNVKSFIPSRNGVQQAFFVLQN